MSEMKPLLDESVSPDAARLLRSAEKDGPESPESAEARTIAAIGLLSSAEIAPSSSTSRMFGSFTRAGTLSAVAAIAVFGAVIAVRSSSTASSPAPAVETAVVTDAPPSVTPPAPSSAEGVRVDQLPTAVADDGVDKVSGPRLAATTKTPARPTLEDELAAIDTARGALAAGHPDVALGRVHDYQRKFRDGRFVEEAEALEVQALAALGRRDEAREKGVRFLTSHPGSPYERRVRSAVDSEVKP